MNTQRALGILLAPCGGILEHEKLSLLHQGKRIPREAPPRYTTVVKPLFEMNTNAKKRTKRRYSPNRVACRVLAQERGGGTKNAESGA
jgi:hypothetical protein